jgi:hypothetical protein
MSKQQMTVTVDVQYAPGGDGNCSGGRFQASCNQEGITVREKNVEICYQLSDATPPGIIFHGFTANPAGQLSKPTISKDGRTMTTIDSDTQAGRIKVDLEFQDTTVFVYDPEVDNVPPPG